MEITDSNEKFVGRYFCLTFVKTRGLEKMGKKITIAQYKSEKFHF